MKLAYVFPGQGSQSVGMLATLAQVYSEVSDTFEEASEAVGLNLLKLAQAGPVEALNQTENTQPVMLAAGIAVWRVWNANNGAPAHFMAGHSLGEYTALVCAGVLDFATAALLVQTRGRLMQSAVSDGEGAMAAILGLEDQRVIDLCGQAQQGEVVAAVNFNSPGQVVVAGHAQAVARLIDLASGAGAKRAIPLAVSVPSHSSLMLDAADELTEYMASLDFRAPAVPVLHNVDVSAYDDPSEIKAALVRQLYSPVRWSDIVRSLASQDVKIVLELGPGKVLANLNKRIDRSLQSICVQDPASLEKAIIQCQEGA